MPGLLLFPVYMNDNATTLNPSTRLFQIADECIEYGEVVNMTLTDCLRACVSYPTGLTLTWCLSYTNIKWSQALFMCVPLQLLNSTGS